MIINLTDDRRLTSNSEQYQLESRGFKRSGPDKGAEVWEPYRFYSCLEAALKRAPEQLLMESDAYGFPEVMKTLEGLKIMTKKALGV